jgi:hypothetical protein
MERWPDRQRRGCTYESFDGLGLAEVYKGIQQEIGEYLENLKRPEDKSRVDNRQFMRETKKYLVSDPILNWRQALNKPLAKLLVNVEQKSTPIESAHGLSRHCRREEMIGNVG